MEKEPTLRELEKNELMTSGALFHHGTYASLWSCMHAKLLLDAATNADSASQS